MSISFNRNDDTTGATWNLERASFRDLYQRVTVGGTTKLQRCRHYTITQSRRGFGLTSISPDNRTNQSSFNLFTGAGVTLAFSSTSRKYICTLDDVQVIDKKTGEAVQTQQWEHYTKWADVPDSEFGTTEDAD